MDRFMIALAGMVAAGATLVASPEPAKAEDFGHAKQWIAQRFHQGSRTHIQRPPIVQRSFARVKPRPRQVAAQRMAYSRPLTRRVAYRNPAPYRPVVRRIVHGPSPVIYYQPVVQRVYVVHRPVFLYR